MRTRLDRYKIRQHMAIQKMGRFEDLINRADISQTAFYTSVDSHKWKSQTLDALANALKCSPIELLTVDSVEAVESKELA